MFTLILVVVLGDDSFFIREKAQKELSCRITFNLYLMLKDYQNGDAEVMRRVKEVVRNYETTLREQYKVAHKNYLAYPQIDEGLPRDYKWQSMDRGEIICHYLSLAALENKHWARYPHFPRYRRAAQIWMQDRINLDFSESIKSAKSEEEFEKWMKKRMEANQKLMEMLIEGDKKWYDEKIKVKNPYKIEKG